MIIKIKDQPANRLIIKKNSNEKYVQPMLHKK